MGDAYISGLGAADRRTEILRARNMAAAEADIVALEAATTVTAWTAVTFQNGWVNYGSPVQTVQYRRVGDEVQLRGGAKSGTVAFVMFTLPVGFRPLSGLYFASCSNNLFGQFEVLPSGAVTLTVGSNVSAHLDTVRFSTTA